MKTNNNKIGHRSGSAEGGVPRSGSAATCRTRNTADTFLRNRRWRLMLVRCSNSRTRITANAFLRNTRYRLILVGFVVILLVARNVP